MSDKGDAFLAAAEAVWVEHGDLGLTVRRIAAKADSGSSVVIYSNRFGSLAGLIRVMSERAAGEALGLTDIARRHADALAPAEAVHWLVAQLVDRPVVARMLATGSGPRGWTGPELDEARARLLEVVGSRLGVEALHGLIAGEIAGRWCPSEDERLAAMRAVLAMGDER